MSEQNPPGTPAEGPDPFAELLKGLIDEPAPEQTDPAQPASEQPATSSADVPTVAFTPVESPAPEASPVEPTPAAAPADEPTVAFSPEPAPSDAEPAAPFPAPAAAVSEPIPAAGTPSSGLAPTVVLPGAVDPTAATTVLAGGGGGLPPSEPPRGGGFRDWDPRRKALFITLVSVAGLLLIALVILLVVLLGGGKAEPGPTPTRTGTSAPTPTPTRSATPTPTPTPTPTVKPAVQSFTVNSNTAVCADTGAGTNVTMHFAWTVVGNPTQIAIASGPAAMDAIANPFQNNLPATATDFQMPFGCANAQLTYSLTLAGADGQHYSGVVTVVRQVTPPPVPAPTLTSVSWSDGTDYVTCPSFDNGDMVAKDVTWASTPDNTTVEIWLATSDSGYPGSGGSFAKVVGNLGANGTYSVPIDCGTSGAESYFTVHVIASNISGSTDAYLDGRTAS